MDRGGRTSGMRPSSVAKRAAIIDAAAAIFVRDGYDPASMDDIADVAEVSKQTLYSHFGNKEGLFVQVLEAETARAFDALRIAEQEPGSITAESLPDYLRSLGEAFLAVVLTPRMIGLRRLAIAESHRFPAPAAAFAGGGHDRSVEALSAVFAHLVDAGLLSGDPERAADAFVLLVVVGPVDRAMFGRSRTTSGEHVVEAVGTFLAVFGSGKH